jgi:DNA-binding transcriptional LysR family regulator
MQIQLGSRQNGIHTIPSSNTTMDTLRALEAFVNSVELGSLSGAARALDTTQPTVSKLVAGLERSLGVRLLRRTAAG